MLMVLRPRLNINTSCTLIGKCQSHHKACLWLWIGYMVVELVCGHGLGMYLWVRGSVGTPRVGDIFGRLRGHNMTA